MVSILKILVRLKNDGIMKFEDDSVAILKLFIYQEWKQKTMKTSLKKETVIAHDVL